MIKRAQLCYGIANNHPLQMAISELHNTACMYLIINGFDITASQQEVENLIIQSVTLEI